jgi:hypothetical protein
LPLLLLLLLLSLPLVRAKSLMAEPRQGLSIIHYVTRSTLLPFLACKVKATPLFSFSGPKMRSATAYTAVLTCKK